MQPFFSIRVGDVFMKKVLTIFLCGQLLIFTYIFNTSIYEIYGLLNMGDTTLSPYYVENTSTDQLSSLYIFFESYQLPIQIINAPISEDKIIYDIYHTQINKVHKFLGLGKTYYNYYELTMDDFVNSSGHFYSSISSELKNEIAQKMNIEILYDESQNNFTSYSSIFYNNMLNMLLLFLVTAIVMTCYSLNKNKENAIKFLHGYNQTRIILSRIKDIFVIETILFIFINLFTNIYYILNNRWSLLYSIMLSCFLFIILIFNMLLLFVVQKTFRNSNICNLLKNNLYSSQMNITMTVLKVVFLIIITLSVTQSYNIYINLKLNEATIQKYSILADLYSSYGYNASEAQKIRANNSMIMVSDRVKEMYMSNYEIAYVMNESVTNLSLAGPGFNIAPQELHNSYLYNYAVMNKNYINDYTQVEVSFDKCNINTTLLLVPEKYQGQESLLYEHYFTIVHNMLNYNRNYNQNLPEKETNIKIQYINNGYSYKLLSSYRYMEETNIELQDAIIIIDQGQFDSAYYFNLLSDEKLAFKMQSISEFQLLLKDYELQKLFHAQTLLEPFQIRINNYKFLLYQSMLYIIIFCMTTFFIVYISNFIKIMTNKNRYAIKFLYGYSLLQINKYEIVSAFMLLTIGAILKIFHFQVLFYFIFILFDLALYFLLYLDITKNKITIILNGGC